mgnify:CR=1 FL=1
MKPVLVKENSDLCDQPTTWNYSTEQIVNCALYEQIFQRRNIKNRVLFVMERLLEDER